MLNHDVYSQKEQNQRMCVWIVDEDRKHADTVSTLLQEKGYDIVHVDFGKNHLRSISTVNPGIMLIDLKTVQNQERDWLDHVKGICPNVVFVLMIEPELLPEAVRTLHKGAYAYLCKPLDPLELHAVLQHCREKIQLILDKIRMERELLEVQGTFKDLNDRLKMVVASMKTLASCSYLDQLGKVLLKEFAYNMAAQGGSIYICRGDQLVLLESLDPGHAYHTISIPMQPGSVFEESVRLKRSLLIQNIQENRQVKPSGWMGYRDGSLLIFPFFSDKEELLALISLHNRVEPPFSPDDLEMGNLLTSFGSEVFRSIRALEDCRKNEREYRHLVDNLPDIFYRTDMKGNIIMMSPSVNKVFGYEPDEAVGKNVFTDFFVVPKMAELLQLSLKENGTLNNFEMPVRHKDGRVVWISTNTHYYRDENNNILGVEGMIRDVTREAMLQEQLRQSQKMEAMGTLAGGIAHDFNNILAAIIGNTELAQLEAGEKPLLQEYIQHILKASLRAKDLVNRILNFSRSSESELKPINVAYHIREIMKLLRASLPASIEIRQCIDVEPLYILADATQLHQVIMNICTNAGHAMLEKGGVLEVRLNLAEACHDFFYRFPGRRPDQYIKLSISDTGHGMSDEVLHKIFKPYFTTKKKGMGTGLGLTLAQSIVCNLQGQISVQSFPEKGSIFDIFLPICEKETGETPQPTNISLPKGSERILIVDDEEEVVQICSQIMEFLGYTVTSTTSSLSALDIFRKQPFDFDIIVTDMFMPKMTGETLVMELKAIRSDIPIILFSGFNEEITQSRACEIGIDSFLMKPVSMKDLACTLRRVLNQKRSTH